MIRGTHRPFTKDLLQQFVLIFWALKRCIFGATQVIIPFGGMKRAMENPSPTGNMCSPSPAMRNRCSIRIESATTRDANPPATKLQKTRYLVFGRDSIYGVFGYRSSILQKNVATTASNECISINNIRQRTTKEKERMQWKGYVYNDGYNHNNPIGRGDPFQRSRIQRTTSRKRQARIPSEQQQVHPDLLHHLLSCIALDKLLAKCSIRSFVKAPGCKGLGGSQFTLRVHWDFDYDTW